MPHQCNSVCRRLIDLLLQGPPNGVWENTLSSYDPELGRAADRCFRVEVRPIGNKKLLVLRDEESSIQFLDSFSSNSSRRSSAPSPLSPPPTPSDNRSGIPASNDRFYRVNVSWVESLNHFYVNDVDRVPNQLRQIEETLRSLRGPQTPMSDRDLIIGTRGIVRSQDFGTTCGSGVGWTRVEIKRVDSDGVLAFCIDYGNEVKLPHRSICAMPRFVADYSPQSTACRLKNPANERLLWSPVHTRYFLLLLRQCDYVLHSRCQLQDILCAATKNSVRIVDFYVELADGVCKSAAETVLYLEQMNRLAPRLPPTPCMTGSADVDMEPLSESLASSLALSPPPFPAYDHENSSPPTAREAALLPAQPAAPLPPPMSLPERNSWVSVFIPAEFRRLCGIRPNYIIICPSPIKTDFDASMRGFKDAMNVAPPLRSADVVKGGCYAARVTGIGVWSRDREGSAASSATWARVVATELSAESRWRVFCGDLGVWAAEPVHSKDMRLLPDEYVKMPFQAILADLNVDPVDDKVEDESKRTPARYSPETFKLLQEKLKGASLLQAHVKEIAQQPESWPRVKFTLSTLMREDQPDCLVRALIKRNLVQLRDS